MPTCALAPALLLVLAVPALGSETLPAVPAGHRAEYYVLGDDGAYSFGYDTGEGQSAEASADQRNEVRGRYSYVDGTGNTISVAYTAGESGFVPRLEKEGRVPGRVGVSGPGTGKAAARFRVPVSTDALAASYSQGDESYDPNPDAAYSVSIDTDNYKRTESSDAKGNIRGQHSYSSQAGGSHSLSHIAGEDLGFSESTERSGVRAGSLSSKPSTYYTEPTADIKRNLNSDGTYSFSFSTNDQSRQESADSHNNVRGSYSFKARDDGVTRRINYTAGSATGFVATGSHLPVSSETAGRTLLKYSSLSQSSPTFSDQIISSSQGPRPSSYSFISGIGTPRGGTGSDGSYSFAYNAGDSSRQESADIQNNVRGSFTFKAKDNGQIRKVDYEADAAAGFVAKESHIPSVLNPTSQVSTGGYSGVLSSNSPVRVDSDTSSGSRGEEMPSGDASYSFSYNAGDQSRQESSDAQGNVKGQYSFLGTDGVQRIVDYSAGSGRGFVANVASSGASTSFGSFRQSPVTSRLSEAGISSTGLQSDGSYSFSHNTGEHSHQELGDAQNNVRGTDSFRAKDDGQIRDIKHKTGAATGFIATGTQPPAVATLYEAQSDSSLPSRSVSAGPSAHTSNTAVRNDGSYSFSYITANQSRQESGDAKNNVRGSFTFKAKDDGETRRVDYQAGAATGFIAKGAHIPEGPTEHSSVSDTTGIISLPTKYFTSSPHITSHISEALKPSARSHFSYNPAAQSHDFSSDIQGNNISQDDRSSGDASYSYSYQTDSSSKQEISDAQGNVVGTFSFLGGDGISRRVYYTSRGNDGFIVSGEHLPKDASSGTIGESAGYSVH